MIKKNIDKIKLKITDIDCFQRLAANFGIELLKENAKDNPGLQVYIKNKANYDILKDILIKEMPLKDRVIENPNLLKPEEIITQLKLIYSPTVLCEYAQNKESHGELEEALKYIIKTLEAAKFLTSDIIQFIGGLLTTSADEEKGSVNFCIRHLFSADADSCLVSNVINGLSWSDKYKVKFIAEYVSLWDKSEYEYNLFTFALQTGSSTCLLNIVTTLQKYDQTDKELLQDLEEIFVKTYRVKNNSKNSHACIFATGMLYQETTRLTHAFKVIIDVLQKLELVDAQIVNFISKIIHTQRGGENFREYIESLEKSEEYIKNFSDALEQTTLNGKTLKELLKYKEYNVVLILSSFGDIMKPLEFYNLVKLNATGFEAQIKEIEEWVPAKFQFQVYEICYTYFINKKQVKKSDYTLFLKVWIAHSLEKKDAKGALQAMIALTTNEDDFETILDAIDVLIKAQCSFMEDEKQLVQQLCRLLAYRINAKNILYSKMLQAIYDLAKQITPEILIEGEKDVKKIAKYYHDMIFNATGSHSAGFKTINHEVAIALIEKYIPKSDQASLFLLLAEETSSFDAYEVFSNRCLNSLLQILSNVDIDFKTILDVINKVIKVKFSFTEEDKKLVQQLCGILQSKIASNDSFYVDMLHAVYGLAKQLTPEISKDDEGDVEKMAQYHYDIIVNATAVFNQAIEGLIYYCVPTEARGDVLLLFAINTKDANARDSFIEAYSTDETVVMKALVNKATKLIEKGYNDAAKKLIEILIERGHLKEAYNLVKDGNDSELLSGIATRMIRSLKI